MSAKPSPRMALLLIAGLFVLPLVLAWMMYRGTIEFNPAATRNFGELVEPPQPIAWAGITVDGAAGGPENPFAGHWLVLHAVPNPCGEACLAAVTDLRQVHLASGREQGRIQLALLHDLQNPGASARLREIYSAFHLVENPDRQLWRSLAGLTDKGSPDDAADGGTFLVDPLGNIMMAYQAGSDPNGLKQDLKRLLTWSKVDKQH